MKKTLLFVLAFSAGCASYLLYNHIPKDHIANFTPTFKARCAIEGTVRNAPRYSTTFYKENKMEFSLNSEAIRIGNYSQKSRGIVKVSIYGHNDRFDIGDKIRLEGEIQKPSGPRNPGGFDYKAHLANQRIYSIFTSKKRSKLEILSKGSPYSISNLASDLRRRLSSLIDSYTAYPENEVLKAMLLGEREGIPERLNDSFKKTGTVHILSISGLHVGFVILFFLFVFRLSRIPKKAGYIFVIAFLAFYSILTGANPPVVRAAIMACVYLIGLLLNREHDLLNTLAFAALIILIFIPNDLFDVGFQLSFISVFSILYFTPKIEAIIPDRLMQRKPILRATALDKVSYYTMKSLSVSAAAVLGTAPFIIYYFNIFSPSALIANLFAVPLSALVVFEGLCLAIFGWAFGFVGKILGQLAWVSIWLMNWLNGLIANIPFAFFRIRSLSVFEILLIYGAIFLIFCYKKLRFSKIKVTVLLLVVCGLFAWKEIAKPIQRNLKITFFDVGHGDSALIESPKGGLILIDGGKFGDSDDGRWTIAPYLWKKGITKINYVIVTHPDSDHIGGMPFLLENFRVRKVFDNGLAARSQIYYDYKNVIRKRKVPTQVVKRGDVVEIGDVMFEVLNPPQEPFHGTKSDDNNNSLVLKIAYKGNSILLCGDIERDAITRLLAQEGDRLRADILKLPHHGGGKQKYIDALIEAANPRTVVISEKDIPRLQRQVSYLKAKGIDLRTTAEEGAVVISLD